MSELLDHAKSAVRLALAKGAKDAAAQAYRSRDVSLDWRDGKVEKVSDATTRGIALSLYVDGRYANVSTSDLRADALARFVDDAVAMTKAIAKDTNRVLPDPALYAGRASVDLQLEDSSEGAVNPELRAKLAHEIEAAARAADSRGAILSVTTGVSHGSSESARVTSNGFEGEARGTYFDIWADATVKDGDGRRPEGSAYAWSRFLRELPHASEVGKLATERASARLGSKKVPSAVLPMLVESRVAGRLVSALIGPLGGRAIQQKASYLEGRVGQVVASKLLTIHDDPLRPKGVGSRLFDGEGIAAKSFPIVEGGVLKTYFVDTYYGRKLAISPTTARPSNLKFTLGDKDVDGLLRAMKDGILVTGFLGGNSNDTTGDFSLGVEGFRVRNGARAEPVGEMNISANQLALWKELAAVGSDPYPYSAYRTPSLLFAKVQFAGS